MTANNSGSNAPRRTPGFSSEDTVVFYDDGPGDNTPRPPRPELLQRALAEREKIARYKAMMEQLKRQQQPPENQGEPSPPSEPNG